jgi:hypothetical protein
VDWRWTLPVWRAVDLDRVVQLRQAGEGEDCVDVQFGVAKDPGAAGRDIGRGDEQAGRLGCAQARESTSRSSTGRSGFTPNGLSW